MKAGQPSAILPAPSEGVNAMKSGTPQFDVFDGQGKHTNGIRATVAGKDSTAD